jgi:hypothetical protein
MDQPQPQIMDPLFKPTPSLCTKNTQDANKSHCVALNVDYFFMVTRVKKTEKTKK